MGQNDQEVMIGGDPKFGVIRRTFEKVEKLRKVFTAPVTKLCEDCIQTNTKAR